MFQRNLTQTQVCEMFSYIDGKLYWRKKTSKKTVVGKEAGTIRKNDAYRQIMVNYCTYRTHRLVYLYHYGWMPEIVDHINQNPIDNPNWFAKALSLLKGPGDSEDKIDLLANGQMYSKTAPDQNEDITISDNNLNIEQCRQLYERLVFKVKRIYSQVHTDYIYFGEPYRSAFVASFNLNRILAREGGVFFTDPSAQSFYLFKKIILKEINQAQIEFETYPFTWSQVHPIIKGILGVLAILAILPFLCIIASSSEGYKKTFFSPPTPNLTEIKEELATFINFSHIK